LSTSTVLRLRSVATTKDAVAMSRSRPRTETAPVASGWHELQVANPSFLVEKLGAECGDLQGLRELTVNGIEAIVALGSSHRGRVIWDLDWEHAIRSDGRVRKLSVIDTGTGMTPEQMYEFINQVAASGREQSRTGNFGVGAMIAAGSRNPHGLEYRSLAARARGDGAVHVRPRRPLGPAGPTPARLHHRLLAAAH
jgi:hypothetical protein